MGDSLNVYRMKTMKTKVVVIGNDRIGIYMNGVLFDEVSSFKYL